MKLYKYQMPTRERSGLIKGTTVGLETPLNDELQSYHQILKVPESEKGREKKMNER